MTELVLWLQSAATLVAHVVVVASIARFGNLNSSLARHVSGKTCVPV